MADIVAVSVNGVCSARARAFITDPCNGLAEIIMSLVFFASAFWKKDARNVQPWSIRTRKKKIVDTKAMLVGSTEGGERQRLSCCLSECLARFNDDIMMTHTARTGD